MLNRFENLKYREIAEKLSLPEKKVENQMGKALKILRESLREHLPLLFTIILLYHD
jgi:RNA polymerase sigma-70 factor (ECF subfamily)